MLELKDLSNERISADWNNEHRFNRDFALEGASPPSIQVQLQNDRVTVLTHHKMGDYASPYMCLEELDELVNKMNDKGFIVRKTEGVIKYENGITRPKFYYYFKTIVIPEEVKTEKELFNYIEEKLNN